MKIIDSLEDCQKYYSKTDLPSAIKYIAVSDVLEKVMIDDL